jgi:hypothetical protein
MSFINAEQNECIARGGGCSIPGLPVAGDQPLAPFAAQGSSRSSDLAAAYHHRTMRIGGPDSSDLLNLSCQLLDDFFVAENRVSCQLPSAENRAERRHPWHKRERWRPLSPAQPTSS